MTAKQYLKQLQKLDILIRQKKEEVQQLRESLTSIGAINVSGERVMGGLVDPNAHYVDQILKINELEKIIGYEINNFTQFKHTIINQIQSLSNCNYIEVLYKRYVQFQSLEQIAVDLNYSYQYIRVMHGCALQNFQQTFNKII